MKKELFLRGKAIFQIIILLVAVIYFSYAIKPVEAVSDVCCEKTINGQTCFYGDSGNCDPSKQYAATKCEQTSFCKTGCCYVLSEGQCYKAVPQSTCTSVDGAEWSTDATCDKVDECRLGCCVIGSQCKFTTEQSCALQTAKYPDLKMNYQSDKTTEPECLDVCRAAEKGCCINPDKTCSYGLREACDAAKGEFSNGQYCSDVALCGCAKHNGKTCNDDDVYWVDGCGNLEDVAEDCDYAQGTLCKKMQGEYKCGTVNCETTYSDEKNVHDSKMGSLRKNGESWCVYESGTGDYKDRVGSRQYRNMCVNGEEVVESCRDYREEICIQAEVNSYTQSQCLHNDIYESPITQQISTVPRGFRFWEDQGACSEADQDCTVVWVKKSRYASWKCEQNCQCETQDWVDDMAKACKSLGDCGANLNIAGEKTTDGLVLSGRGKKGPPSGEPSEEAWADWSQYGVFGGMVDLLENLLAAIQDLGIEAPKGLFGMGGLGAGLIAGAVVGAALLVISSAFTSAVTTVAVSVFGAAAGWGTSATAAGSLLGMSAATVIGIVIVIIVVIIMMIFLGGSKMKEYHVILECKPWQAPTGGKNCEQCLDQKKVDELGFYDTCTEYKCKSLGQNCQFIPENAGTERVACYNSNPNDVNSPMISPWEEALTEGFQLSTISEGYEITPEAPYYEKIEFGIKTNELSQCKISSEHKESYEEMTSYFGDSFYQMEHNITINPQVGGKTFEYYVRCRDGSGNSNAADYAIRFTTTKEPDKTAPKIEGTSIKDYGYVPVSVKETGFAAYINEPADCKWSFTDKKYDEMENLFYCMDNQYDPEDQDEEDEHTEDVGYDTNACYAILNITAQGINTYYFRCQDRSEFKNQNQQSYTFHLTSTTELKITSQSPEGTLLDTVSPTISVTTEAGAEEGKAKCYYTDDKTRDISLWPEFYETGTTIHSQPFMNLAQGEHNYYVTCKDAASNEANTTISFKIDKDVKPPKLEYIYIDTVALHLVLDEPSTCEYNNATFNYGEGIKMQGAGTDHNTASVGSQYYYINCEDAYLNHWDDPIIVYL
jgi:hypothetical protein